MMQNLFIYLKKKKGNRLQLKETFRMGHKIITEDSLQKEFPITHFMTFCIKSNPSFQSLRMCHTVIILIGFTVHVSCDLDNRSKLVNSSLHGLKNMEIA